MNIQITGHNIDVTPALREFAEKKLKRLKKHMNNITNIHVTFNIDKLSQIVEAQVMLPGNKIHAKAKSNDMYHAVDELIHKLIRQLDKYRDKLTGHR